MRKQRRVRDSSGLDGLIEKGRAAKLKSFMTRPVTKRRIAGIKDNASTLKTNQDDILEVFAAFYEALYFHSGVEDPSTWTCNTNFFDADFYEIRGSIEKFLKRMKNGKSCAEDGLVAEMLKCGGQHLIDIIATMFADLLAGRGGHPAHWKLNRLMVLFKKGDTTLPKNYRPIVILPVMCKLFSGMLLERIRDTMSEQMLPEEMGFRTDYSCSDLIHTLRMIGEKSIEWGETVWMASLDLEKAFDKIIHTAVFEGLAKAGIDDCTIQAIRELYAGQGAYVDLGSGSRSRLFQILRGVRQGDPLSPSLFANSVRFTMKSLKDKWERSKLGTVVGSNSKEKERISFAMFADDTTLVAKSKRALKIMLHDIQRALADIGLNLNADKCSIQCSVPQASSLVVVDGQQFPVICRDAGFKVLGTRFTLNGSTGAEFDLRMQAAFGKFNELWPLLGKRDSCLRRRLQLFQATVTKSALWCAESWTLTVAQKRHLRAVQRHFLRKIAGPRRAPDEDYIERIRRSTHIAEKRARDTGIECWLMQFLHMKWRWAGRLVRMTSERLAKRSTFWRDSEWWQFQPQGGSAYGVRPFRARPGNILRWEDDMRKFAKSRGWSSWQVEASNETSWENLGDQFAEWAWR